MFNKCAEFVCSEIINISKKIGRPQKTGYYYSLPEGEYAEVEKILCFSHSFKNIQYASNNAHHHRFLLAISLESPAFIVIDELFIRVKPFNAVLVHPFQFHHYAGFKDKKRQWQFISFESNDKDKLALLKDRSIPLSEDALMSLYKILNAFVHYRNENSGLALIELSLKLMLQEMLITVSSRDTSDLKKSGGEKADHKFISAVTQYLYSNIKKPIQIADIAENMHISKSHLRNKFKEIMGLSIGKYLQRTRIHRACILLSGSEANISEIALECGFDSLYSFSRAFKNEMGVSPSKYKTN